MPRGRKCRQIGFHPRHFGFNPENENDFGAVWIDIDELESIRLIDLEGLDQSEAALSMNISRGTLQRMLYNARKKIADALINGKQIKINDEIGEEVFNMPRLDGKGPNGEGPKTGRQMGNCPGSKRPVGNPQGRMQQGRPNNRRGV